MNQEPTSIKIKCPQCAKEIKVNVKTIDDLRERIEYLEGVIESLRPKKGYKHTDGKDFGDFFSQFLHDNNRT